ncbi:hypothetical protein BESB_022940 [Besnoitia besnoiti]|uniref:Uncharacterized protein n=1 Tax=Besnoitia besnoiti TaxID=94643 RepID=A0A2A9M8T2_BESBE|nr:hypothetical protein BESB_022940 [Besnoitia besnoiti]PFH31802.1 hypothetical protein BESB_022940 [Besnoitia besnoiti]
MTGRTAAEASGRRSARGGEGASAWSGTSRREAQRDRRAAPNKVEALLASPPLPELLNGDARRGKEAEESARRASACAAKAVNGLSRGFASPSFSSLSPTVSSVPSVSAVVLPAPDAAGLSPPLGVASPPASEVGGCGTSTASTASRPRGTELARKQTRTEDAGEAGARPQWHADAAKVGILSHGGRRFWKKRKAGMISLVYENALRSKGVHAYRYDILQGHVSAADGVGFVFANRVPCGKNIQTLWSVFVNRQGTLCKRMGLQLVKQPPPGLGLLEAGSSVFLLVDLDRKLALFQMKNGAGTETEPRLLDFGDMAQGASCSQGYFCVVIAAGDVSVEVSDPSEFRHLYATHVRGAALTSLPSPAAPAFSACRAPVTSPGPSACRSPPRVPPPPPLLASPPRSPLVPLRRGALPAHAPLSPSAFPALFAPPFSAASHASAIPCAPSASAASIASQVSEPSSSSVAAPAASAPLISTPASSSGASATSRRPSTSSSVAASPPLAAVQGPFGPPRAQRSSQAAHAAESRVIGRTLSFSSLPPIPLSSFPSLPAPVPLPTVPPLLSPPSAFSSAVCSLVQQDESASLRLPALPRREAMRSISCASSASSSPSFSSSAFSTVAALLRSPQHLAGGLEPDPPAGARNEKAREATDEDADMSRVQRVTSMPLSSEARAPSPPAQLRLGPITLGGGEPADGLFWSGASGDTVSSSRPVEPKAAESDGWSSLMVAPPFGFPWFGWGSTPSEADADLSKNASTLPSPYSSSSLPAAPASASAFLSSPSATAFASAPGSSAAFSAGIAAPLAPPLFLSHPGDVQRDEAFFPSSASCTFATSPFSFFSSDLSGPNAAAAAVAAAAATQHPSVFLEFERLAATAVGATVLSSENIPPSPFSSPARLVWNNRAAYAHVIAAAAHMTAAAQAIVREAHQCPGPDGAATASWAPMGTAGPGDPAAGTRDEAEKKQTGEGAADAHTHGSGGLSPELDEEQSRPEDGKTSLFHASENGDQTAEKVTRHVGCCAVGFSNAAPHSAECCHGDACARDGQEIVQCSPLGSSPPLMFPLFLPGESRRDVDLLRKEEIVSDKTETAGAGLDGRNSENHRQGSEAGATRFAEAPLRGVK